MNNIYFDKKKFKDIIVAGTPALLISLRSKLDEDIYWDYKSRIKITGKGKMRIY